MLAKKNRSHTLVTEEEKATHVGQAVEGALNREGSKLDKA